MNTMSAVFSARDKRHPQFEPVLNHINSGKSKMIIGGSTYDMELRKMPNFYKLLAEMRRSKKLLVANGNDVDQLEQAIAKKYPMATYPDFNDKHIVALAYSTNARLVCTIDKPLKRYLKQRDFYNKSKQRPSIYNEVSKSTILPSANFIPKCNLC